MYLLVDPSDSDDVSIYYCLDTKWVQRNFPWSGEAGLLGALNKTLTDLTKTLGDLGGMAVVLSHGRFTATRVAVTVANTLSYSLGIPVVGVPSSQTTHLVELIRAQPVGRLIHASYSGEARIGKKTKKQESKKAKNPESKKTK